MKLKETIHKILKEQKRIEYATIPEIKEFLMSQGVTEVKKLKKSELIELFNENFNLENFDIYIEVSGFGLLAKDIRELFQIGDGTIKRLRDEGVLTVKTIKKNRLNGVTYIYNVSDIIAAVESGRMPQNTKKKTVVPEMTDFNLAEALYLVNKSAKVSRDTKSENYDKKRHKVTQAAKTRERDLYQIKDAAMDKLISEGKMKHIGYHKQDGKLLEFFEFKGFTFHRPIPYKKVEIAKTIDYKISAKKNIDNMHINYDEAIALLKVYIG